MACRRAYQMKAEKKTLPEQKVIVESPVVEKQVDRLLFGVDSQIQSNDLLQNNIEQFEWVVRNKIYPNFYGRNLVGKSCLTYLFSIKVLKSLNPFLIRF